MLNKTDYLFASGQKSSKIVRHCFQKGLSTQGAYNFNLDLKPGQNPAGADVCLTGKNLFASQWVEIFSDESIIILIPLPYPYYLMAIVAHLG